MGASMEIRYFKVDEIDILQKGINDLWAKGHVFTKDEKLLKYMFYENPYNYLLIDNEHLSFLGAWKDDRMIGLLGVMPSVFNIKGQKSFGCCMTNWIVSSKYRNTGAGLALLSKLQQASPNILLSLGINEKVAKLYKIMRWNVVENVPRWVGLTNKERTIKKLLNGDFNPLRYWNDLKPIQNNSSYLVKEVVDLDEKMWNEFYWGNFAKRTIGFARDYLFLSWRYLNNSFFDYKTIICYDTYGNYKGIAIIRIEHILNNEKIGRIVEFISTNQDSSIALANFLISIDKDILFFDFFCFSSISSWGLEAVGFKRISKSHEDQFNFPLRFQPIDLNMTDLIASLYASPKFKKEYNVIEDEMWYVTKGDSDQDRPN